RDLGTYGFLGYPLLQSADIVMYGEPKKDLLVPVGEDQAPHVELTREIVRRFNTHFGVGISDRAWDPKSDSARKFRNLFESQIPVDQQMKSIDDPFLWDRQLPLMRVIRRMIREDGFQNFLDRLPVKLRNFITHKEILREPAYIPTETPRLPGLDGRRMAKSYGNAIFLSDPPDEIRAKVRNMMTDPQRVRRTDPGRPEICPVFAWHKLFSPPDTVARIDRDCRSAAIGCVDCKKEMAENLVRWIEPIQAERKKWEADPKEVWGILNAGSAQARKAARRTMKRVRNAIFQWDAARKTSTAPSK
ncbi:MAG: tryptophan--tRNA ligase, partial [Candidatus Acidiferrales bacterium]